jgi:DNA-binding CsgD family transcriptional regulator
VDPVLLFGEREAVSESSVLLDRAFAEAKRLCYAGLDEEALLRKVTERVRRVVPFEAYCVHANDPSSGLITYAIPGDARVEEKTPVFLEHVYFEDEVTPFGWMVRKRLPAIPLSEATGGRLERALRYRELMVPMGFRHEVRGAFALDSELWGSITTLREPGSPDFDAREVAFFRRVAPHLAAGLKAAALRSEAVTEQSDADAMVPGVLVLDQQARVNQHTGAAERWLRELGDLRPGWQEARVLPSAVWSVVGALHQALGPGTDRERNGIPRLLVRGRSGRWLALHGAKTEPRPDRGSETIIVIEPAGPREVAWLRTSAYDLSSREREVVDLVVRGLSTKQISQTLYISEYTVQEHLSNVFDKVGVRGRRALVKRLYLDSLFFSEDSRQHR